MESHVRVLGWLYVVFGCVGGIAALIILVLFGGLAAFLGVANMDNSDARTAAPIVAVIGLGVAVLVLVLTIPQILTGFGLLKFRPWARILGIILSALNLLNFGIGTLLGLYGLWVLLQRETESLFSRA
jgi:hypothetical protein